MDYVVDTSAIVALILHEPTRSRLLELTRDATLTAPHSLHWEIGNALGTLLKRRLLTIDEAQRAAESYARMPIRFVDVSLARALELVSLHRIYAYDAYMLVCASDEEVPLITQDRGLARVAREIGVEVIEVQP